ncbi:sulfite exporter TauE/SafE family protein [Breznakiella homolactica]|uniref:Probable membrane transporter protein n=1 Tax=Breznakiella homolactica TaxID=2798577 RepID=A0A7T7XLH8_9SPIR|nr:TSUP family transporter [Breznakiella homolactica]QQO08501.1 TSUP family transporter [Breznakiella homolactica]
MFEITWQTALILFPMLFLAAFVDSAAGGGALISLPAYMFAGFPVHYVYGTNKFSAGMAALFSTGRYLKNGKIAFLPTLCACAGAALGSWLGAKIVLMLDAVLLQYIFTILLPIAGIFIIVYQIKKPEKHEPREIPRNREIVLSLIIGLGIGAYDGFFGPGTGTFLILAFNGILGMEIITAAGSARTVNLSSNIAALITYIAGGKVIWAAAIPGAVFAILGGQLGTYFAVKKGARFIRPLMIVVVVLLMAKVVYDFFSS